MPPAYQTTLEDKYKVAVLLVRARETIVASLKDSGTGTKDAKNPPYVISLIDHALCEVLTPDEIMNAFGRAAPPKCERLYRQRGADMITAYMQNSVSDEED